MEFFFLLLITGLVTGATYGLIAMSMALVYKATGVVNFATGEIMMVNAYVAYTIGTTFELPFFALMAVTVPLAMALGLLIERLIIRPMLGEPIFSIVMVTIGLAAVLRGTAILVWGADTVEFSAGLSDSIIHIGPVTFYAAQLYAVGTLAVLLAALWALLRFHRIGIAIRAVASNESAALLMGVNVGRIHGFVWAVSSAVSCVSGVLFAAMYHLGPTIWFQALKSFPALVFGGLDSVVGGAIGGIFVGIAENLAQGYLGNGLREVVGFIVIVVVLMARPYGLFGEPDIERV